MASKTGGLLQDQNLNIRFNEASVGWNTNVSKAPSKRGAALAGRTPLGDLSNSLKPSMNRATRKQLSTLFSPLIEKEAITSGIALDATKKKNTSKASLKLQPAGRKALFDISNSGKPQVNVASKRNYNTKLGVVAEVAEKEAVSSGIALDATKKKNTSKASLKQQPAGRKALFDISNSGKPQVNVASKRNYNTKRGVVAEVAEKEAVTSGIALDATKKKNTSKASLKQQPAGRKVFFDIDGGFRHNHEECIKAEAELIEVMNMNRWPQMSGLYYGGKKSPLQTPSASFRKEAVKHKEAHDNSDSPPIRPERLRRPSMSSDDSDSPPISPEHSVRWSDYDWRDFECNFKLIESPDFRLRDSIDYDDDLRIDIDRDWRDIEANGTTFS